MFSQFLIISILFVLYILSVLAVHFFGTSAYKLSKQPPASVEDDEDEEPVG